MRIVASLVYLLTACWVFPLTSAASELIELESVAVVPGELLKHPVAWQREPGVRVEFKLVNAPKGAKLVFDTQGQLWIEWLTTTRLADETLLLVAIRDVDKNIRLQHMRFIVRNANVAIEEPVSEAQQEFGARAGQTTIPTTAPRTRPKPPPAPVIESTSTAEVIQQNQTAERSANVQTHPSSNSLAKITATKDKEPGDLPVVDAADAQFTLTRIENQIVSVGRAVSFKAAVSSGNAGLVELSIDRLPANASFEINADGSRTFFWQTGPKDQGEHRFRILAQHVSNDKSRKIQDVIIVVGDPALGSTQPEEFSDTGS